MKRRTSSSYPPSPHTHILFCQTGILHAGFILPNAQTITSHSARMNRHFVSSCTVTERWMDCSLGAFLHSPWRCLRSVCCRFLNLSRDATRYHRRCDVSSKKKKEMSICATHHRISIEWNTCCNEISHQGQPGI